MLYYIYYNIYYNIYNIKLVSPCFPKTIFPNVARSACSVKRDMAACCAGAMVRIHHLFPGKKRVAKFLTPVMNIRHADFTQS